MHRYHFAFLLVFLLNFETIFGGKCEIVRFVKENNIARKCCALNKKVSDRSVEDLKNQGYVVLRDNQTTSICRDIEKSVMESTNGKVEKGKIEKNIPNMGVHQFVDSSNRCPDGTVFDFQGNCVSPFE